MVRNDRLDCTEVSSNRYELEVQWRVQGLNLNVSWNSRDRVFIGY